MIIGASLRLAGLYSRSKEMNIMFASVADKGVFSTLAFWIRSRISIPVPDRMSSFRPVLELDLDEAEDDLLWRFLLLYSVAFFPLRREVSSENMKNVRSVEKSDRLDNLRFFSLRRETWSEYVKHVRSVEKSDRLDSLQELDVSDELDSAGELDASDDTEAYVGVETSEENEVLDDAEDLYHCDDSEDSDNPEESEEVDAVDKSE